MASSPGIDYGMGMTNIDGETGIRYGVIPGNRVPYWDDSAEAEYGSPSCPECGGDVVEFDDGEDSAAYDEYREMGGFNDYVCDSCEILLSSDCCFPDSPIAWIVREGNLFAHQDSDGDIWIARSPYYTRAAFCSPCAPGAVWIADAVDVDTEGFHPHGGEADLLAWPRAYCLGPEWFDSGDAEGVWGERMTCPYPIWRVSDDSLVYVPDAGAEGDL